MRQLKTNRLKKWLWLGLACAAVTACGPQEFSALQKSKDVDGPGTYVLSPKVDLLLAVDDTGGMSEAIQNIRGQVPVFLKNLENSGWNYHLATTGLTTERAMSQVLASRDDPNWGSQWTPPYQGALPSDVIGAIASWAFRFPGAYTDLSVVTHTTGSKEPGFETILQTLANDQDGTGFLRNDALSVVFVIGTGDDTSRRTSCTYTNLNGLSTTQACDLITSGVQQLPQECSTLPDVNGDQPGGAQCKSYESSMTYYENALRSVKSGNNQIQFYSAVNNSGAAKSCSLASGSTTNAFYGKRYVRMANDLGGTSYDICSQSISSILTNLQSRLDSQRRAYVSRYIFLDDVPDLNQAVTITVYRATNPTVPQVLSINDWHYEEIPESAPVYSIELPQPMNLTFGHAIVLNSNVVLKGDDRVKVDYTPAGNSGTAQ